ALVERVAKLLGPAIEGPIVVATPLDCRDGQCPVRLRTEPSALHDVAMTRAEALHVRERRALADRGPEGERMVDPVRIEAPRQRRVGEESLDLRREPEQRSVAAPSACEQQARPAPVPEREGDLAVQALAERLTVLLVEVHEDLAVRVRAEAMAMLHEVLAEVGIVEDLAVEDGDHAVVL